jgi:hypothetical protein
LLLYNYGLLSAYPVLRINSKLVTMAFYEQASRAANTSKVADFARDAEVEHRVFEVLHC